MKNFWMRDHDSATPANQPDDNGQQYTTMTRPQANDYADRVARDGMNVIDDTLSNSRIPIVGEIDGPNVTLYDRPQGGIDNPGLVDILVTEPDSSGTDAPTRYHAPGY
jgi:hypothetical protein